MPVDADFIERSLQRIVEEEKSKILRRLSEVDTVFIKGRSWRRQFTMDDGAPSRDRRGSISGR
jgi:hypothetical protein